MTTITFRNMRFTLLAPDCLRMEYSPCGSFRNEETLFAANRSMGCNSFSCGYDSIEGIFHLKTAVLEVEWYYQASVPRGATLIVHQGDLRWVYGKPNKGNLGGTLPSLDTCCAPIPLPQDGFLSREGWCVIDDSDAASINDGWLSHAPHEEGYLDIYYFGYGHNYRRALQLLTNLSGTIPLLPRWAMGSWYSRWFQYTSDDYRKLRQEYAEHGYPLDVMVLDMEWHTRSATCGYGWAGTLGWTGWSWNRELLPDAEQLLQEFHDNGIRIAMNVHPHDGIRSHESCYPAFMEAMGRNADGSSLPFDAGDRRYMEAYFSCAHAPLEAAGCDAWWVDWQQDCISPWVKDLPGTRHIPWLNRCYYLHSQSNGRRGLSFSRWGGYGDQKYPIHFSGDTTATWNVLAFEIAFTLITGNSGAFFWTHDMGGFCGRRNEELYARWLQFGIFTAAMRLHSAGDDLDRRPWKWTPRIEASLKGSFRLRSRFMPYLYSAMHDACRDSFPMLRPLYLEYPDEDEAYCNYQQFQVGEHLLVAPITSPGEGENSLAFQKMQVFDGEWRSFYSCMRYTPGTYAIPAALEEMPLLVRTGIALPMGAPDKVHLADLDATLTLLLFPPTNQCEHSYLLYEDDGETTAYMQGEYAETSICTKADAHRATITVQPPDGHFNGMISNRSFALEIRCIEKVKSLKVNGNNTSFVLDEAHHILTVDAVHEQSIVFEVEYEIVPEMQLQREAREHYKDASANARRLMAGEGVLPLRNPLTGAQSLLVWPKELQKITAEASNGRLQTTVNVLGESPLEIMPEVKMNFHYKDGTLYSFTASESLEE